MGSGSGVGSGMGPESPLIQRSASALRHRRRAPTRIGVGQRPRYPRLRSVWGDNRVKAAISVMVSSNGRESRDRTVCGTPPR